jgi:hypothetical protein
MILALFPVLFLLASIGSLFVYQRSRNEQFQLLAVVMAMIAILWLLTISHWSFQILCLLLLFFYDWDRNRECAAFGDHAKISTVDETIVNNRAKKIS